MREFWMVWNERGSQPRVKHDSEHSARAEAERLAMAHSGELFIVLHAIGACARLKPVEWLPMGPTDDEIPF